ncbi:hypothetical protein [Embleya sp. NPDC001921]
MTDTEPDLAAIRTDQTLAAMRRPTDLLASVNAIQRVIDIHLPALLDLAERQAATIASCEKSANSDGRIIASLESINDEVCTENGRLAAELADARAEVERLRASGEDPSPDCPAAATPTAEHFRVQVYELFGEWSSVGRYWSAEADAVASMRRRRQAQADWPAMRVLRVRSWTERTVVVWEHPEDVTGTRDASRAPESPADAPDPSNDPRSD